MTSFNFQGSKLKRQSLHMKNITWLRRLWNHFFFYFRKFVTFSTPMRQMTQGMCDRLPVFQNCEKFCSAHTIWGNSVVIEIEVDCMVICSVKYLLKTTFSFGNVMYIFTFFDLLPSCGKNISWSSLININVQVDVPSIAS